MVFLLRKAWAVTSENGRPGRFWKGSGRSEDRAATHVRQRHRPQTYFWILNGGKKVSNNFLNTIEQTPYHNFSRGKCPSASARETRRRNWRGGRKTNEIGKCAQFLAATPWKTISAPRLRRETRPLWHLTVFSCCQSSLLKLAPHRNHNYRISFTWTSANPTKI